MARDGDMAPACDLAALGATGFFFAGELRAAALSGFFSGDRLGEGLGFFRAAGAFCFFLAETAFAEFFLTTRAGFFDRVAVFFPRVVFF